MGTTLLWGKIERLVLSAWRNGSSNYHINVCKSLKGGCREGRISVLSVIHIEPGQEAMKQTGTQEIPNIK